jgi:glycosyltransferase involved in cell wall biosynthesis
VVPNYVQTDLFIPRPEVEKCFDIVFVGRGTEQKNLDALFEALCRLRDTDRDVSLLMIGSCCDRDDLRELADRERLRVEFAGRKSTRELPGQLNRAKMYILPSLYEGHPKTLLEAMSCGMACIGANVEGIREEIEHGGTGWVCEPDGESIARSIGALLDDGKLRARLGEAARRHIVENLTLEKVAALELDFVKQLTSKDR